MSAVAHQHETVTRIQAWNLDQVKAYMVNRKNVDPDRIDVLADEYKKFIALNLLFPDRKIPIARQLDDVWHTHVLFTKNYTEFCDAVNDGVFIHHRPAIDDSERNTLESAYSTNTLPLYEQTFGTVNRDIWGHDAQECGCCD